MKDAEEGKGNCRQQLFMEKLYENNVEKNCNKNIQSQRKSNLKQVIITSHKSIKQVIKYCKKINNLS
jgi:hypothetical protein